MADFITLSDQTVPVEYRVDPLPGVLASYGAKLFTKSVADEKEIAQVFVEGLSKTRIGWMIPIISLISIEHQCADDVYFRKHAYEAVKLLTGMNLHETIYVLVYSKRLLADANIALDGELALSFGLYGIYPYRKYASTADIQNKSQATGKLTVKKGFNFDRATGFFKFLLEDFLPTEMNSYARFMFFYQIYELAMEMVFYKKVSELKTARSHLGMIRKKMDDYSSEGKLIAVLYKEMNRDQNDSILSAVAKSIFEDLKDAEYYTSTDKSAMIYEIRNVLVHSYYRYSIEQNLSYLASYIEDEAFHVLNYIFSVTEMRQELESKYFNAAIDAVLPTGPTIAQ